MRRPLIFYGVCAALALGAFWVIAPGDRPQVERDWRSWRYRTSPQVLAAAEAWIAVRDTVAAQEHVWELTDSRERAVRALPASAAREGFAVVADADVPAAFRDGIESVVREEIGEIAGGRAQYPVVVRVLVDTIVHPVNTYRRAVVLPQVAGEPCNVIMRLSRNTQAWSQRAGRERLLGTCGFYAAYGAPGVGMHAWLLETGMRTAAYVSSPVPWVTRTEQLNAESWLELAACRTGRTAGCADIFNGRRERLQWFMETRLIESTPGVSVQAPLVYFNAYERVSRGLLGEISRSLGPVTFAALWQSAEPPERAMQQLTGMSPAEWVQQRVAVSVRPYNPGPSVPTLPLAMGLLLFAGLTTWTMVRVKREMT